MISDKFLGIKILLTDASLISSSYILLALSKNFGFVALLETHIIKICRLIDDCINLGISVCP